MGTLIIGTNPFYFKKRLKSTKKALKQLFLLHFNRKTNKSDKICGFKNTPF